MSRHVTGMRERKREKSLLQRKFAAVGIASLVLTGALFATENSYAKSAPKPAAITYKNLSYKDFTLNFAALKDISPLAAKGKGNVDVILPDTTSSTRYTEFDAPYLDEAFKDAGLKSSQYKVQNGEGSDATFITDAEADITAGAKVLLIDPEDSGTGETVESYAAAHNVKIIDYDRLTLGGSRAYYVSFNNVFVGTLLGQGLVACVKAWNVASPQVIVMHGATTDNNATLFAQGYDAVLAPEFSSDGWKDVANPAGTWTRRRRRPSSSRHTPRTPARTLCSRRMTRTRRRSSATSNPSGSSRTPSR